MVRVGAFLLTWVDSDQAIPEYVVPKSIETMILRSSIVAYDEDDAMWLPLSLENYAMRVSAKKNVEKRSNERERKMQERCMCSQFTAPILHAYCITVPLSSEVRLSG